MRVPRLICAAALLALCGAAWWSLPSGICMDDSGELQLASIVLGVMHPPGSALIVLLGYPFTRLAAFEPAYGVTLMNWLAGVAVLTLTMNLLLRLEVRWQAALAAVLGLGAWSVFWELWTAPDVYVPILLLIVLLAQALLRWEESGRRRDLFLAALFMGCLLGSRNSTLTYLPFVLAAGALIARRRPVSGLRRKFGAAGVALTLAGLLTPPAVAVGYLWLRDAPTTEYNYITQWNEAGKLFPPDRFDAGIKLERLRWLLTAQQYWTEFNPSPRNQWYRLNRFIDEATAMGFAKLLPLVGLAIAGGVVMFRRRFGLTVAMTGVFLAECAFLLSYYVTNLYTMTLPVTWLLVVLGAIGTEAALRRATADFERRGIDPAGPVAAFVLVLVLGSAAFFCARRMTAPPPPAKAEARSRIAQIRWADVPQDAVIVTRWPHVAPVWYGSLIKGGRSDLRVVCPQLFTWHRFVTECTAPVYYPLDYRILTPPKWRLQPEHGMWRLIRPTTQPDQE